MVFPISTFIKFLVPISSLVNQIKCLREESYQDLEKLKHHIYIYIYIYSPHFKVDREEDVYTAILFKTQKHRSEIEGKERIYKSHYRKDKIH